MTNLFSALAWMAMSGSGMTKDHWVVQVPGTGLPVIPQAQYQKAGSEEL